MRLLRAAICIDRAFVGAIDIYPGDSGPFIQISDPRRAGTVECERRTVSGIHGKDGAAAAVNGIVVVVPRACEDDAAAVLLDAGRGSTCRGPT